MLIVLPMLRSGRTATTLQPDYTTAGQLREAGVVRRINHADIFFAHGTIITVYRGMKSSDGVQSSKAQNDETVTTASEHFGRWLYNHDYSSSTALRPFDDIHADLLFIYSIVQMPCPRLEASTLPAKEDLATTGGRGSRVHNRLAVVIGAGSLVVQVATALAGPAQQ